MSFLTRKALSSGVYLWTTATYGPAPGSSLLSVEWGQQRPLRPADTPVAPPESGRSTSVSVTEVLRGGSGEAPAGLRRGDGVVTGP